MQKIDEKRRGGRRSRSIAAGGRIVVTCAVLVLGMTLAWADPAADCDQIDDLDRQMRGCTTYIRRGQGTPQNLATAYFNRGNLYATKRRYDRAFSDYAVAIELDPQNALVLYNRGNAYFDTRQYDRAIADYSAAIERGPDFALAHYNRGLAYERRGDRRSAAEDYRRALALDPAAEHVRKRLKDLQEQ